MNIPNFNLYITERAKVPDFHGSNITHLISIGDPEQKKPYIAHFSRRPIILRQEYDDALEEDGGCAQWVTPTEKDILQIIRFGEDIKKQLDKGEIVNLVSHCFAGVSRSTAAAYIILNVLTGAGHEKDCFDEVLRVRSCALPNPFMCKIADKLLCRNGELVKLANDYRDKYLINISKNE